MKQKCEKVLRMTKDGENMDLVKIGEKRHKRMKKLLDFSRAMITRYHMHDKRYHGRDDAFILNFSNAF